MIVKPEAAQSSAAAPVLNSTEPVRNANLCAFEGHPCGNPRVTKRSGAPGPFCELHRAQTTNAQRKKKQRDRLLRYLVNALQQDDPITSGMPERDARPRQRPRLVLLGNQQTLILGVVLSDRGAAAAADLAGLRP